MPRERTTSANARHECFVMDGSVWVRTAETAEMDDKQAAMHRPACRILRKLAENPVISFATSRALVLATVGSSYA